MSDMRVAGELLSPVPIVKKHEKNAGSLCQVPTAVMQGDELHLRGEALVLGTTTVHG